jgi:ferritin
MLNENLHQALNRQLNDELYAAQIYLALSAYLDDQQFRGMASWARGQAQDERRHMRKMYDYINDRGGRVKLSALPAPPGAWGSPREAFAAAFEHEQQLSEQIGQLAALAREQGDHTTVDFLQWFVKKQADEEAELRDIVAQLDRVGEDPTGMLLLDRELAN